MQRDQIGYWSGILRQLLAEEQLRTDLRNAADAQQDSVQALIERVAVVAVEEDERLVSSPAFPRSC